MNIRILWIMLLASLGDMMLWGFTGVSGGWFTTALFYTLLAQQASFLEIALVGIFCMSQLFIMIGSYGTDLSSMVPLGAAVYYLRRMSHLSGFALALFIGAIVFVQWCFLQGFFGGAVVSFYQFLGAFLSAVVMVYLVPGSQGNRLLW